MGWFKRIKSILSIFYWFGKKRDQPWSYQDPCLELQDHLVHFEKEKARMRSKWSKFQKIGERRSLLCVSGLCIGRSIGRSAYHNAHLSCDDLVDVVQTPQPRIIGDADEMESRVEDLLRMMGLQITETGDSEGLAKEVVDRLNFFYF